MDSITKFLETVKQQVRERERSGFVEIQHIEYGEMNCVIYGVTNRGSFRATTDWNGNLIFDGLSRQR